MLGREAARICTWHKTDVHKSDLDFSVEWACSAPESDTRTWAVMDDDHPAAACSSLSLPPSLSRQPFANRIIRTAMQRHPSIWQTMSERAGGPGGAPSERPSFLPSFLLWPFESLVGKCARVQRSKKGHHNANNLAAALMLMHGQRNTGGVLEEKYTSKQPPRPSKSAVQIY